MRWADMTEDRRAAVRMTIKQTEPAVLLKVVEEIGGDGHGIWAAQLFLELGLDPMVVAAFTDIYESSPGNEMTTIYIDDRPVNQLEGVYGLNLVEVIAEVFGIKSVRIGRGSRANDLCRMLRRRFGSPTGE